MTFTREDIAGFAHHVLGLFEDNGILSAEDFDRYSGHSFPTPSGDTTLIDIRPSAGGTSAKTVSYITGYGIPLETRINTELGYSAIILKGDFILDSYIPFGADHMGNIHQYKQWYSASLSDMKRELAFLCSKDISEF